MDGSTPITGSDQSSVNIRPRLYFGDDDTVQYLDAVHTRMIQSRAVEHPFLQWYANNHLTPSQEKILYSECYYWFRHLPFYISLMSGVTRDPRILKEITLNVLDEVGGERTHAEIYLDFLRGIGISKEDVRRYSPSDEALALNGGMARLYSRPPVEKALGALYFDEAMSSIMVSKINDGLKYEGYSQHVRFFWEMHIDVEHGHSNSVFNAIYPYLRDDISREIFEDGAQALEHLVERFWDAVTQRLNLGFLLPT